MEAVNNSLELAKGKATAATETVKAGSELTEVFLAHIAATVTDLDYFSARLPSKEILNALAGHVTTARDETLDAYSILHRHNEQSDNANLAKATELAQLALGRLGAKYNEDQEIAPSTSANVAKLQAGIDQLQNHLAELKSLTNETGDMYRAINGDLQRAAAEGDGAIAEITTYQQERGVGAEHYEH